MEQSARDSEVVKYRFVGTRDVLGMPIPDAYVDTFIQQIEKSPFLVAQINSYIAQNSDNRIRFADGEAIYSNQKEIMLPRLVYIAAGTNESIREQLAIGTAHELGHRNNPLGHVATATATNPKEARELVRQKEGIAITAEYLAAREFRALKVQQGEKLPEVNTWTPGIMQPLDALANKYLAAGKSLDSKGFQKEAMQIGGGITAKLIPSVYPHMTYDDSAEYQWFEQKLPLGTLSKELAGNFMSPDRLTTISIDNKSIKRSNFAYDINAQGETVFAISLPMGISSQANPTPLRETHQFIIKTDHRGQVIDYQHPPFDPDFSPEQAVKNYQPSQKLTSDLNQRNLSPEIKALYQVVDSQLRSTLEKLNVAEKHADAMIASMVLECVNKKMTADQFRDVGINTKQNLIIARGKGEFQFACIDAIAASRNDPEQTLALAQQQLEQQPHLEQQMQSQQMERQQQRSFGGMSM